MDNSPTTEAATEGTYEAPALTDLGSFVELTMGGPKAGSNDNKNFFS